MQEEVFSSFRPAPASPPRRNMNRPPLPPIVTRSPPKASSSRSTAHAKEPSLDQFVFPLNFTANSSASSSASTSRSSSVDIRDDSPPDTPTRSKRDGMGRRRSSGASSAEMGLEMSTSCLTPRMERAKKTIIVPGITLTPPHSPTTVLPILQSHAIDNPFIGGGAKRPRGLAPKRPSFLRTVTSLLPLSPTKEGGRRSTIGLFEEEEMTDSDEEDVRKPPRRAFSMPASISNALEWAKSASSSGSVSPISVSDSESLPAAVREKMFQQAEGFSLPPIPTSSSALFSPPPVSAPTFFTGNMSFPSRKETASPPASSRRRSQSRSPLFILIFPLFVIALHIYLSLADARFMHSGRSLVFGTPHDHRHSLAVGVKLDMKEAWSKFEEKLAAKGAQAEEAGMQRWKRFFADEQVFSADGEVEMDEIDEDQADVLAFLQEMQEAAYIGVEL